MYDFCFFFLDVSFLGKKKFHKMEDHFAYKIFIALILLGSYSGPSLGRSCHSSVIDLSQMCRGGVQIPVSDFVSSCHRQTFKLEPVGMTWRAFFFTY